MFRLLVVFVVCIGHTKATTCTECKTTYSDADKDDDTKKCTAWKAYMTCLESSALTDAGCPLTATEAAAVKADHDAIATNCDLDAVEACACQKTFWGTDQTSKSGKCTALAAYLKCLAPAASGGCADESVATLSTKASTNLVATQCIGCEEQSGAGQVSALVTLVMSLAAGAMM
ncbi:uncharacterized protein LOC124128796 [Haliotis rufescens]|uniref:uncharacterized protein LOC124128796 n=1 Tax=Haliotis rufescens TaxID=6454 RepID=UPI00201F9B0F|nr:uncharacterized protein LOC124128796 [Haliotis rufescens]